MRQFAEFVFNHMILASTFVVLLVFLVYEELKRKSQGFREIKPMEAVHLINHEDAFVVDVREVKDFQQGHVLHALNIPMHELEGRVKGLENPKTRPVIVYCRTGQNSTRAGAVLRKQGFEKIFTLAGGIMAWQGADLPVTKK